ncbi:MAG: nucleotidyltransferase domain-containing protein [Candidatus Methanoperedens sp.]|nr:nucleotidyltransferase domain-containing protein [Candidatus Methanoperedens sp.]MCZ7399588.1 nucleotidyltransferase domain-containing protein [Candidatus Methanoperedens sp.]
MQTSQNTIKLKDFRTEFKNWCQQNSEIVDVEFFGSAIDRPNEWVRGKSDIDVVVFGNNISGETKRLTHKLFWGLNQKYDLRLEDVAALHPLIFFIDSPHRQVLYALIKSGKFDSPEFRKLLKRILKNLPKDIIHNNYI